MQAKLPLEAITLVLKDLKGFFTFSTVHGDYVVIRKEEFNELQAAAHEKQLSLPPLPSTEEQPDVDDFNGALSDDAAEHVDTFVAPEMEHMDTFDDLAIPSADADNPGKKVKFEPLRGDLPPELQE